MKRIVLMGFLSALLAILSCDKKQVQSEEPEWANEPRKLRTESELTKLGIPINRWLPIVESEEVARIRDPKEVARRAVVLNAVATIGHGGDKDIMKQFLEDEGLWEFVTAEEKILFDPAAPPKQAIINAAWRVEALWALLWALGKIDKLDLPKATCDVDIIHKAIPKKGEVAEFISSATLRSKSEILDETDRIYRIHWAVRDAQINGKAIPADLNPGVVVERHRALNWLTGYADEWDDVTTDI